MIDIEIASLITRVLIGAGQIAVVLYGITRMTQANERRALEGLIAGMETVIARTAAAIIKATATALTSLDAARVRAAVASSRAANTRIAYAGQWARFADWMQSLQVEPLPASPEHAAAYLADRANNGIKPATLKQAAAIGNESLCGYTTWRLHGAVFAHPSQSLG